MGINYITTTAEEARAAFTTEIGNNGEEFTRLRDGAPEWLADAVYLAHDGQLPDNRIFELVADACEWIARGDVTHRNLYDEVRHEFADDAVDIYDACLLAWLAHPYRAEIADMAAEEMGAGNAGTIERAGLGQYVEAARVFDAIAEAIETEAEERENTALMDEDINRGDAWQDMAPARSIASVMFEEVA